MINRKDRTSASIQDIKNEISEVKNKIKEVDGKQDKSEAMRARTQILRFADEIYHDIGHTKEHFEEILDEITLYNQYCVEHPDFKNMRTVNAQARINEVYQECEEKHLFLEHTSRNKRGNNEWQKQLLI